MNDEQLKHFVENMKAAGQSDEMIADSLIRAGNDRLMVLNAFGVSTMEELEDNSVNVLSGAADAPIIDEHGNLQFGKIEDIPTPEPQPAKHVTKMRDKPRPAPKRTILGNERKKPVPVKDLIRENERKAKEKAEAAKHATPQKKVAPLTRHETKATNLHGQGSLPKSTLVFDVKPVKQKAKPKKPKPAKKLDSSVHGKHHDPHTYSETMEDLTDHKELESGFDHEIEGGLSAPSAVLKAVEKREVKKKPHTNSADDLQDDKTPLPQEIDAHNLEDIDHQDTAHLKKVAAGIEDEVQEINKPNQPVHAVPTSELAKAGAAAKNVLGNKTLLGAVLLVFAALLVGLAFSVIKKISG